MTRDDFTPGMIYKVASCFGSGNSRLMTFKVVTAPYFNPEYGDGGEWLISAVRWIESKKKFSGQAYIHFPDGLIERGAKIIK